MEAAEKTLIELTERSKNNTHRIEELEQNQKIIQELALSVREIALNTQAMQKELVAQGEMCIRDRFEACYGLFYTEFSIKDSLPTKNIQIANEKFESKAIAHFFVPTAIYAAAPGRR